MGTLFAGIIRAPMTSVFMIFEITQDYQILVPLMVANLLSFVVSRHFQPVPVYHALLHQDDIHLPVSSGPLAKSARTARHVMHTDVVYLPADLSVTTALDWTAEHPAPIYLVGTPDDFLGTITREQLQDAHDSGPTNKAVSAVARRSTVHAHADHSIDVVLDRLVDGGGVLPIVSRSDARHVEGIVTRDSLLPGGRHSDRQASPTQ
jgi:CIC family chloride channel protein